MKPTVEWYICEPRLLGAAGAGEPENRNRMGASPQPCRHLGLWPPEQWEDPFPWWKPQLWFLLQPPQDTHPIKENKPQCHKPMHQMCLEFLEKYHIDAVCTSQRPVCEPIHPSSLIASIGLIADSCGRRRSTEQSASSCLFCSSVGEEPTPGGAQQLAEPVAVRAALRGNGPVSAHLVPTRLPALFLG